MRSMLLAVACALVPTVVTAQAPAEPTAPSHSVTILAGGGNSLGWWGVQAERYLARGAFSAFVGVGRDGDLTHLSSNDNFAFAGGVRAYTSGTENRLFAELSVSQVVADVSIRATVDPSAYPFVRTPRYGPGLQVGYQHISHGGFTLMLSAGYGYALGLRSTSDQRAGQPMAGFGIGYTFH